jgi:hypothetical protein
MRRGIGLDAFDDDIDTGPVARRHRLFVEESYAERVSREKRDAQDELELRDMYARAGVWRRR